MFGAESSQFKYNRFYQFFTINSNRFVMKTSEINLHKKNPAISRALGYYV